VTWGGAVLGSFLLVSLFLHAKGRYSASVPVFEIKGTQVVQKERNVVDPWSESTIDSLMTKINGGGLKKFTVS
jgi:hypothetical protein